MAGKNGVSALQSWEFLPGALWLLVRDLLSSLEETTHCFMIDFKEDGLK